MGPKISGGSFSDKITGTVIGLKLELKTDTEWKFLSGSAGIPIRCLKTDIMVSTVFCIEPK